MNNTDKMSQIKFLSDVIIGGNLTIQGTSYTESAEQLLTKGALTVTNADNQALNTTLMGSVIRTGKTNASGDYIDYAIIYDPISETIRLGVGTYNTESNTFAFNPGEGKPLATRDLTEDDDGYLIMWDANNHCLVKSTIKDEDGVITLGDLIVENEADIYTIHTNALDASEEILLQGQSVATQPDLEQLSEDIQADLGELSQSFQEELQTLAESTQASLEILSKGERLPDNLDILTHVENLIRNEHGYWIKHFALSNSTYPKDAAGNFINLPNNKYQYGYATVINYFRHATIILWAVNEQPTCYRRREYDNDEILTPGSPEYLNKWTGNWITVLDSNIMRKLTVKLNGGETEGSSKFTFDGSETKTINITPSSIGAAPSRHTHVKSEITDLAPDTDATVTLSADIWTDKTIGYIAGTSSSPKKVGSQGESLKTVFTRIFGTVTDDSSNLVTNPSISSVSIGNSSYEYGTKLTSVSVTVTPASGSYKYGPAVSGAGWNGNYKLEGTGFTTKNDSTSNTQTVSLSSPFTVGTSSQLTLTASRAYNAATNTATTKMGNATEQKIAAGTATKSGTFNPSAQKYVYWAKTATTTTPTSWTRYGSGQTGITDLQLSCAAGEYLWVAATDNKTSFYAWNDASGKYNTDKLPTTKSGTTAITNAQGASAPGYYIYRTTDKMLQAVNTKFKLA